MLKMTLSHNPRQCCNRLRWIDKISNLSVSSFLSFLFPF